MLAGAKGWRGNFVKLEKNPPEIEVERSWVHSGEGYEAQLVCIVHGEPNPDVNPPEIEVERSWVHSGEGYEAQLVCIVHGEPNPDMSWYQDTFLIEPSVSDRRLMETRGNKHTLTIKNVQSTDFGNYSCVADNNLGRAKKYMELSGKPSLAEFKSPPMSRTKDSYNLTWQIESYPPLLKVRLLYRKVRANDTYSGKRKAADFQYRRHNMQHGSWHDQELLPPKSETFSHVMSYSINNLEPSSTYAAVVQAMNKYGWGAATEDFFFHTRSQGEFCGGLMGILRGRCPGSKALIISPYYNKGLLFSKYSGEKPTEKPVRVEQKVQTVQILLSRPVDLIVRLNKSVCQEASIPNI
ncbi:neural cell adhesion molecule 1-A-like [Diaphorina citri]|uniref:Neural cell adhesion molecule 1-A-like n=1 Tax=Diaphorina citri TaxID=121845 RepID=A0A3Q0JCR4_DIACI|nr:neural cell adhesion molecule 1-A-like [Diaphorina citri]